MDFGNLPQTSLEILSRFILHTSILDETCEVMFPIVTSRPAEIVNVAVECVRSGRWEFVSEEFLDLPFEDIKSHTIDSIFQTGILTATKKITVPHKRVFNMEVREI